MVIKGRQKCSTVDIRKLGRIDLHKYGKFPKIQFVYFIFCKTTLKFFELIYIKIKQKLALLQFVYLHFVQNYF